MTPIFRKIISASLSPDTTGEDVRAALGALGTPWAWKEGPALGRVSKWFADYFSADAVFYTSGRVALFELLTALGIGAGDEVLLQAFTCVAVPNSVLWAGAQPVFADIDDSLNIDPADLQKKITPRTKAVIVEHIFGNPADMDSIVKLAQKYKLILIEDCAHAIGATYNGKKLGTFGDAAFFSFGRDKAVSSVWGGAAIVNAHCRIRTASSKLAVNHRALPMPGSFWIVQQLMHPLAFSIILPLYNSGIGKAVLLLLQKLHLLSKPVAAAELKGSEPHGDRTRYPNALAELLVVQVTKLDRMVNERRTTAAYYRHSIDRRAIGLTMRKGATFLRFPVLVDDPARVLRQARNQGILLGNWYHHVIDPYGVDFGVVGYVPGSCPRAEYMASHIVNLPTLISQAEAQTVIASVK